MGKGEEILSTYCGLNTNQQKTLIPLKTSQQKEYGFLVCGCVRLRVSSPSFRVHVFAW